MHCQKVRRMFTPLVLPTILLVSGQPSLSIMSLPEGKTWNAVFNLNINPSAPNTYKNFALVLASDDDPWWRQL